MQRDLLVTALVSVFSLGTAVAALTSEEDRPGASARRTEKSTARAAQPRREVEISRVSASRFEAVNYSTATEASSVGPASRRAMFAAVPPANDSCSSPDPIVGLGPFAFDNFDTAIPGDGPIHSDFVPGGCLDPFLLSFGGGMDHDIWFCWTSPCTGPVQVETCGPELTDTRLAVYEGCACDCETTPGVSGPCGALQTCNDDGCILSWLSRVTFNAVIGQDYLIRIGTPLGLDGGPGNLNLTCLPPACDQPGANCQEPGQESATDAIRSDTSSPTFSQLLADDFTPTTSTDITEVCWWGIYVGPGATVGQVADCPDPYVQEGFVDDFSIRYYADAGSVPGALIAGPFVKPTCSNFPDKPCTTDGDCKACSVGGAPCQTISDCGALGGDCEQIGTCTDRSLRLTLAEPVQTGFILPLSAPFQEYEYTATHPPVPVSAGECYWIEISNSITPSCPWFWEASPSGNGRAYADDDLLNPPTYEALEFIPGFDAAFCLDIETGDPVGACNPPPPANDDCATGSQPIFDGITFFDTSGATSNGPTELDCNFLANDRIDNDIWFRYQATCSETLFVDLCSGSFDTRVAVYDGAGCPAVPDQAIACNDDACGAGARLQSHVTLNVTAGQVYQIRIGGFESETGPGEVHIGCGANVCQVAQRDCCDATIDPGPGPGCENQACCELICALDSFCCNDYWDENCSTLNTFTSACSVSLQDCTGAPGSCPPGEICLTADAANFCPGICSACTDGQDLYGFIDPPNGLTDARQPHPITNRAAPQGFQVFTATAPPGVEKECWSVCSTDASDSNHEAAPGIVEAPPGTYTITLPNPIKAGATTTIQYTSTTGSTIVTGIYTALPADVDASGISNGADLAALIGCLNSGTCLEWDCDIDRSGTCSGADLEWAVNLFNGAGQFDSWDQAVPVSDRPCP